MSHFIGIAGNSGMPGAQLMHFSLKSNYNSILSSPSSTVNITLGKSNYNIHITEGILAYNQGVYRITIYGFDNSMPWLPPIPFSAILMLQISSSTISPPPLYGTASWTLGSTRISNVSVSGTLNP